MPLNAKDDPPARTPAGGYYVQHFRSMFDERRDRPHFTVLERRPYFSASHWVEGWRSSDARTRWKDPDKVQGANAAFHPEHGRVDEIRCVDDKETLEKLSDLDAEAQMLRERLAEVHRERQDVLAAAWPLAQSVKVADLKKAQEEETPS